MNYLELEGDRWIMAVGQKPFFAGGNEFCTLVPVISENGRRGKPELFPNSGLVWWMVRSGAKGWAQPGRLVVTNLEPSLVYDETDPTKHLYQADADGITPVRARDAVEILTVQDSRFERIEALVDRPASIHLDHHPTDSVWVRLGNDVYGPFKATTEMRSEAQFEVTITLPPNDVTVNRVPESALQAFSGAGYFKSTRVNVSGTSAPVYETVPYSIDYELIAGEALERLLGAGEKIAIETEDRVISRVAKQVLPRKRRQELTALLAELESLVSASAETADAATVVQAIQQRLDVNSKAIDELVDRIFKTGVLDERINEGVEHAINVRIEQQASYMMAEAEQRSADAERKLASLQAQAEVIEEEIEQRRLNAEESLQNELESRRQEFEQNWRERELLIADRERRLEEREMLMRQALEEAARRLDERRGEVVTDVLTVLPLLAPLSHGEGMGRATSTASDVASRSEVTFDLPPFIRTERSAQSRPPLQEEVFFERFEQRVRDAGFAYERDDLLALHLSVKTSDLTLLSGVSGTGKSSLPRFYMDALQGEESAEIEGRYLHVPVRPSWLDQQDILGHVNSLDHEFVPSESGLFPLLVSAAEEFRRRGTDSGLYLVCLDEMNLAQVEHYFGSFLSALERPTGERRIRCFDPASVSTDSPFRTWSQLPLPDTLHFVGTVNYDETTRPLSLRFLDRTNEIELGTQDFHTLRTAARGAKQELVEMSGPAVTLRDIRSWMKVDALSPELAAVLDTLRDPLRRMRRPLTPRRYEALTRFVASAAGLCTPDKAFDLQLSLRLVPQLRSVSTPDAREGLSELVKAFQDEGYALWLPRTWNALQELEMNLRPILDFG